MARKSQKNGKQPANPKERRIYREIIGIFLFFLVVFTLSSLLSFRTTDPSFFNAAPHRDIHNLFGLIGAYTAGLLIHLVGVGAFWIPVLMLLLSFQLFGNISRKAVATRLLGGAVLMVGTAVFFALWRDHYLIFGGRFSAGGLIGESLKTGMVRYSNHIGSAIILVLMLTVGFILATGLSLTASAAYLGKLGLAGLNRGLRGGGAGLKRGAGGTLTLWRTWRERRAEAKKARAASKKWTVNQDAVGSKLSKSKKKKKAPAILTPRSAERDTRSKSDAKREKSEQLVLPLSDKSGFHLPPLTFLDSPKGRPASVDRNFLLEQAKLLEQKLSDFGVKGEVEDVIPGPVITTFEYKPAAGVKINRVANLSDDLALALKAMSVRIVAPIPGKAVIGIEIPNTERETVRLRELVSTDEFRNSASKMTIGLGKDIVGNPVVAQLDKMPHLLIAGATGTGKSVFLNSLICSILYKATPEEVKLIMVDPKRIELSEYDGIPHLISPVVTDVKKATNALFWAVNEMERRYELLSENRVRNITQFNRKVRRESGKEQKTEDGEVIAPLESLPYVVVIIDELADLMLVASRDVEVSLMRLAQMARAAGIHLILATQRPSVDVLTGIIKANFPTRLTFKVSSKTDSRTIIDTNGAETLLGEGDMLYLPPGTAKLQRIHGAYISEEELVQITEFLKQQKEPEYDDSVVEAPVQEKTAGEEEDYDERYDDAVALVTQSGQASISMVQRHLRIGYNRAARIIEVMEREGVVGPSDGAKPREVLVAGYDDIPSRGGR